MDVCSLDCDYFYCGFSNWNCRDSIQAVKDGNSPYEEEGDTTEAGDADIQTCGPEQCDVAKIGNYFCDGECLYPECLMDFGDCCEEYT